MMGLRSTPMPPSDLDLDTFACFHPQRLARKPTPPAHPWVNDPRVSRHMNRGEQRCSAQGSWPLGDRMRRLRKLNSWAAISESYQGLGMI
jgi:hypothetical protein